MLYPGGRAVVVHQGGILADPQKMELLQACDVLVDGPFLLAQRTLEARFRGSRNQRLIQIAPSLAAGTPVLLDLT